MFNNLWTVTKVDQNNYIQNSGKLDRVGPVDRRPSTDEAPPLGKIHLFSKIAVTLEPVMQFGYSLRFEISNKNCNIVYFMTVSTIFNH